MKERQNWFCSIYQKDPEIKEDLGKLNEYLKLEQDCMFVPRSERDKDRQGAGKKYSIYRPAIVF
jgi:hypothetical protein